MKAPATVEGFAEAALAFCTMWRTSKEAQPPLLQVARLLAELHRRALELPEMSSEDDDPLLATTDAREHVVGCVADFDLYWDIFDPLMVAPEQPVANSLADDFGDIYTDLMSGLVHYERGRIGAAAWEWRFLFWKHWGEHLVGAQRAIHLYLRALE